MKNKIKEMFEFSKGMDIKHKVENLVLHHTYNAILKRYSLYVYEDDRGGNEFSCLINEYEDQRIFGFIHPEFCSVNPKLKEILDSLDGKASIELESASMEEALNLSEKSKKLSSFYEVTIILHYASIKNLGDKDIFYPNGKILSDIKKFMSKYDAIDPSFVIWDENFKEFSLKDSNESYTCFHELKYGNDNDVSKSLRASLREYLLSSIENDAFIERFHSAFSYQMNVMGKKEIIAKKESFIISILTKSHLFCPESLSSLEKRFSCSLSDVAEKALLYYLKEKKQ